MLKAALIEWRTASPAAPGTRRLHPPGRYRAAWRPVNERYWIDATETERRRQVLDEVYAKIGVTDRGKKAAILSAAA
jgi:hypothetical protein